jgi:M6 family metalloprotease-like protein
MKSLLTGFLILLSISVYAVPAQPVLITFTQPDGKTVSVYQRGDENLHWFETPDGYTLLYGKDNFLVYAVQDENGDLIPSDIAAYDKAARVSGENILPEIPKYLKFSAKQIAKINKRRVKPLPAKDGQTSTIRRAPAESGKPIRALCVLIGFSDKSFTKTQSEFDKLMNQTGYGTYGSVHDFYLEDSYGNIDMQVTVAGPYTAANPMKYYGENLPDGYDSKPEKLVEEAAIALKADGYNFADFDNDGDGFIDAFHIIFAGYGEESTGVSPDAIWAHANGYPENYTYGDSIWNYSCSPELKGKSGSTITTIGVISHELGHIFGAPDFYDADGSASGGDFHGTGNWDLMASGSWNGPNSDGSRPAHTNIYQKIVNGWVTPVVLTSTQNVTMDNSAENPVAYIIETPVSGDYFVLENRQQTKFDTNLPGHGLMIYHASLTNTDILENTVNTGHRQKMYPVCASASANPSNSVTSYGSINSSGCPFGTGKSFTKDGTPSAAAWNGNTINVAKPANGDITNIKESGGKISFDFTYTYPIKTYSITASAGAGGKISPSGVSTFTEGKNQTYTFTPNANYKISQVLVDGSNIGTPSKYTFSNITANHTISVGFETDCISNLVVQVWDDVLSVINNPDNNGGYTFTSYQWQKNGVDISGETSGNLYLADKIDLTAEYSCRLKTSKGETIITCPLKLKSNSVISAYPNPAQSFVTIENGTIKTGDAISVYSAVGTLVLQKSAESDNTATLDVANLAKGVYFVRVNGKQVKLIKTANE